MEIPTVLFPCLMALHSPDGADCTDWSNIRRQMQRAFEISVVCTQCFMYTGYISTSHFITALSGAVVLTE
jgi:hypothetical protein